MNDLIETAIDGMINEDEILQYIIENGADESLLQDLGYNNVINSSMKTANIIDDILKKCKSEKLLIGVIALLITTGQLFGYEVKKGDTLWDIARNNKCTVQDIYKLNPGLKNKRFIYKGMNIVLPNKITKEMKKSPKEPEININNHSQNETLDIEAALKALREIESSNGANTVGDSGQAIGDYQLWEIFVKDYHRLGGKKEYQCHVVKGVAQPDDVRWDRQKSEEIIRYVFKKYKYKNMEQILRGFGSGKSKRPGWNKNVSKSKLQEYVDAYNKYKK